MSSKKSISFSNGKISLQRNDRVKNCTGIEQQLGLWG